MLRARLLPAAVGLLTAVILASSWVATWTERAKTEEMKSLLPRLDEAILFSGAAAVLLFAFAFHWAAARRWVLAFLALPGLPVWAATLAFADTWFGNKIWILVFLAPMSGIRPFG